MLGERLSLVHVRRGWVLLSGRSAAVQQSGNLPMRVERGADKNKVWGWRGTQVPLQSWEYSRTHCNSGDIPAPIKVVLGSKNYFLPSDDWILSVWELCKRALHIWNLPVPEHHALPSEFPESLAHTEEKEGRQHRPSL